MKILSRISATLSATANDTVARFENHEAIGAAAIERCRRAVADARLAERKHQRAAERFAERRLAAVAEVERWTERAANIAETDESTALSCLERRRQARMTLEKLDEQMQRHDTHGEQLASRVRELETRLDAISTQHAALASRSTLAGADAAIDAVDRSTHGIEDVFDRWEATVDVAEMRSGASLSHAEHVSSGDALEARFAKEERDNELQAELEALKSGATTGDAR